MLSHKIFLFLLLVRGVISTEELSALSFYTMIQSCPGLAISNISSGTELLEFEVYSALLLHPHFFTFGEHFVSCSSVTYLIRWYFETLCYLPISIAFIIIKVLPFSLFLLLLSSFFSASSRYSLFNHVIYCY
jgi:hypothetical protein